MIKTEITINSEVNSDTTQKDLQHHQTNLEQIPDKNNIKLNNKKRSLSPPPPMYHNKFESLMDSSDTSERSDSSDSNSSKSTKKKLKHNNKKKNNNKTNIPTNNNNNNTQKQKQDIFQKVYGVDGKSEINILRKKITIRDIQHYLLWVLLDFQVNNPNWIFTKNKPLIEKVVLININSVSDLMFTKVTLLSGSQPFSNIFKKENKLDLLLPNHSHIYDHLINIKEKSQNQQKQPTAAQQETLAITDYLLSDEDLVINGYPNLKTIQDDNNGIEWCYSKENILIENDRILAIDCEMCRTSKGLELTRISVISDKKLVLLDEYVKPDNVITDYLTQYSGITQETLKDVQTKLPDIHRKLNEIISSNSILLGHSLENDLFAMKYQHCRIIDTSVLYPTGSSGKFPLKYLTNKYLKRTIQNHGSSGHDSIEDAKAVLDLVKLKIQHGKTYGTKLENTINLFNKLSDYEKKSSFIDRLDEIKQYTTPVVSCFHIANDEELTIKTIKQVSNASSNLIFCQLNDLKNHFQSTDLNSKKNIALLKQQQQQQQEQEQQSISISISQEQEQVNNNTTTTTTTTTTTSTTTTTTTNIKLDKEDSKILKNLQQIDGITVDDKVLSIFKELEKNVTSIYNSLQSNTMLILLLGPGPLNDFNKYKNDPLRKHELIMALDTCKEGLAFMTIK